MHNKWQGDGFNVRNQKDTLNERERCCSGRLNCISLTNNNTNTLFATFWDGNCNA